MKLQTAGHVRTWRADLHLPAVFYFVCYTPPLLFPSEAVTQLCVYLTCLTVFLQLCWELSKQTTNNESAIKSHRLVSPAQPNSRAGGRSRIDTCESKCSLMLDSSRLRVICLFAAKASLISEPLRIHARFLSCWLDGKCIRPKPRWRLNFSAGHISLSNFDSSTATVKLNCIFI